MPYFMLQVAYTPEAWGNILANQQNRIEAVRPVVEKLGGKLCQERPQGLCCTNDEGRPFGAAL